MIKDVLDSKVSDIANFGYGNVMFKSGSRSYNLNTEHQTLFRFIDRDGGFTMTEDWFDRTDVLDDKDFRELKQKLKI